MKRRKFTREFKIEAVQLAEESDEEFEIVAAKLGIHHNTLYRWRRQLREDGDEAFPGHGKLKPSDDEVARLQRELARVKEERDILKKAISFFAKESR